MVAIMARRNSTIALFALVALLAIVLSSSAQAQQQQSTIKISVVDGNSIIAENVFDDDGGIEFVDIFISDGTAVNQYRYENVTQGTAFSVAFTPNSTIYYNYMDSDGQVVNVGYFIYVQNAKAPNPPDKDVKEPNAILAYSIKPRLTADNRSYNLEYTFDLNKQINFTSTFIRWGIGDGVGRNKLTPLTYDSADKKWKTTIGPFVGKVIINSGFGAIDSRGKTYYFGIGNNGYQLLVSDIAACNAQAGSVVVANTAASGTDNRDYTLNLDNAQNEKILYNIVEPETLPQKETKLFLQQRSLTDFSYLKIVNIEGTITATDVYDNDGSIQNVDIFVIQGTNSTQYTYTNVRAGATFPVTIPANAVAYYNYMDSDGSVANISYNNLIGDGTLLPPPPSKKPSMYKKLLIDAIPNESYTAYKVNFELTTNDAKINVVRVKLDYKEQGGSKWNSIWMERRGNVWIAEFGPYTNEKTLNLKLTMFDNTGYSEVRWLYPVWFDIIPPSQVRCVEICGNRIDDNKNGQVDEGCVLLPDLIFTDTQNVPFFVVMGNPIIVPFTIKNAGVADSEGFEVGLLLNNELVEKLPIDPLKVGEYNDLEFIITDSNKFEGNNKLRLSVDYGNVVPELNELNNDFDKDLTVGLNGLILILNNNKTDLLGDDREMKTIDRFGNAVIDAKVTITYPSGAVEEKTTSSSGVLALKLTEAGNYLVNAEKASYTPYSGAFNVKAIKVSGIGDVINIGQTVDFTVETEDNKPVADAKIEIEYPTGEKTEIALNNLAQGQIRPTIAGGHKIIVTRNGVKVFESGFIATGLVESLFVGSNSLGELLFGSILRNPLLFVLLLIICLIAAALAYRRSRMLFMQKAKSTREKQIEIAIRIGIALLFFILPFQVNRFFGLQAAIGFVIIEVVVVLIADYYNRQIRMKKAIGVR
jgi:hypothetical protein